MAARIHEAFGFFDLPLELREMVYEYVAEDEILIVSPEPQANLSFQHAPKTSVLLVNREIRSEYHKIANKKITLTFSDHESFNSTLPPVHSRAQSLERISIRNFIVCDTQCPFKRTRCKAASDLQKTLDLIHKIKTVMPNSTTLEVNLGLW